MMGVSQRPSSPDGKRIIPLQAHGVTLMSIGLMVDPSKAVVWRGPMLMGALQQMLSQVEWGELDALIVDLPPGTGDVQLTLLQRIPLTTSIVVTTPQKVAISDCKKGIEMINKLNIPISGLIENMSWFKPDQSDKKYYLFGKDGGKDLSFEYSLDLLAQLPLVELSEEDNIQNNPILKKERSPDLNRFQKPTRNGSCGKTSRSRLARLRLRGQSCFFLSAALAPTSLQDSVCGCWMNLAEIWIGVWRYYCGSFCWG